MNFNPFDDDDDNDEMMEIDIIFGVPNKNYVRTNPLYDLDNSEFFKRFRLSKETILQFLPEIENQIEFPYDINNCVSPINQLLICLRTFATGGHLLSSADFGGVHVSTVSRIVRRVAEAIARLAPQYIKFPSTQNEIIQTQNSFYDIASFPRVIGVVDGTHIKIQSPGGEDAEIFRNRKSYFSINVQIICNANYEITNIVARWPGSTHDSTIFNNSLIRRNFERNMYPNSLLLGDSGYNVRNYLFTPLLNPVTDAERLYNESFIRTRARVENVIGIWKRRFPILAYGCRLKLETVLTVIVATAVLHNLARKNQEIQPPNEDNEHILQMLIEQGQIPDLPGPRINRGIGFEARRNIINHYFGRIN